MRLEHSFTRTDVTFGVADVPPVDATYLSNDNVFDAPQYGVFSEPVESIAFAYDGPALAPDANVTFYLWDDEGDEWYVFATDTISAGDIHYVPMPNIIDRKYSRATSRMNVAIVAAPAAAAPVGNYTFSMSSSTGSSSAPVTAALAAIIALLTSIDGTVTDIEADTTSIDNSLTSIDGKIENPMPVEGATAVGAVPASDPLDLGAVVLDADPAAYVDGDIQRLRLDSFGRLIVSTSGTVTGIEGIVDDDSAVGATKPVVIGGVYYVDPTADTLDDGDAGYALLNELRMLVTESRSYDATSDADKTIPVWNPTDLWTPEDLSGSATGDGTTSYYVALEENSRWSLQYLPNPGGTSVITLTVHQSNEDDPDITARTYTDVTNTFFPVASFTTEEWIEIENPTRAKSLRVDVTVSTYSTSAAWDLWLIKGGNS